MESKGGGAVGPMEDDGTSAVAVFTGGDRRGSFPDMTGEARFLTGTFQVAVGCVRAAESLLRNLD